MYKIWPILVFKILPSLTFWFFRRFSRFLWTIERKYYKPNDDKPFTGLVFKFYKKKEVKELEFQVLDGLMNGF